MRGSKKNKVVYSPNKKNRKILKLMPLSRLLAQPATRFVQHLMEKGLLQKSSDCPRCGKELKLKETTTTSDGVRYKCSGCKSGFSVRTGRIFHKSKMNLKDVAAVTHLFISGAQVKDVTNVCGVSVNSAKKWYTLLRGLIKRFMEATQRPTGGHHLTVEADEVCVGHLRKVRA